MQDGKVVDKMEGADAPTLTQKTSAFSSAFSAAPHAASAQASLTVASEHGVDSIQGRIKFILSTYPIVLFMKV